VAVSGEQLVKVEKLTEPAKVARQKQGSFVS
jgi:hypothetical protein